TWVIGSSAARSSAAPFVVHAPTNAAPTIANPMTSALRPFSHSFEFIIAILLSWNRGIDCNPNDAVIRLPRSGIAAPVPRGTGCASGRSPPADSCLRSIERRAAGTRASTVPGKPPPGVLTVHGNVTRRRDQLGLGRQAIERGARNPSRLRIPGRGRG